MFSASFGAPAAGYSFLRRPPHRGSRLPASDCPPPPPPPQEGPPPPSLGRYAALGLERYRPLSTGGQQAWAGTAAETEPDGTVGMEGMGGDGGDGWGWVGWVGVVR